MHHAPHEVSAPSDFDFVIGDWHVRHRRLVARLAHCTDWIEFDGRMSTRRILGGFGNVEDNILNFPEGTIRAVALRSFDRDTQTWAIWWLSGVTPHQLDVPLIGRFEGDEGLFFADDTFNNAPITIRFIWRKNLGGNPTWEQAFSADGGATWETNWTMEFERDGSR